MSRNYRSVDQTGNGYCGPLVLAAILGCTTAEAAAKVREFNGARSVKGTHTGELARVLRSNGWQMVNQPQPQRYVEDRQPGEPSGVLSHSTLWSTFTYLSGKYERRETVHSDPSMSAPFTPVKPVGPTLAQWMRETSTTRGDAFYIIEVSHHWVLVRGRKFVDTFTKGEWVFLRSAPHRRKRVKNVWQVTR